MKGQAAIEYLMIIGIFFLFITPVVYYTGIESKRSIQLNDAEDTVNTLAKTADYLYALGPGSKDTVQVKIPTGIQSSTIYENEIVIQIFVYGGLADVSAKTNANLTGTIPTQKGIHHIPLEVLDNGAVQIGT